MKFAKAKPKEDKEPQIDIAIPFYGYKSHISIDRRHGLIRRSLVTDAAAHDGARLREGLIDPANTASEVWADTAYRSAANEAFLARAGKVSRIHHKKPKGRPMPKPLARGNATKSAIRARIEHVFAEQKDRMKLFIRTIGLARAEATDHTRQHGLQHEAMVLAQRPERARVGAIRPAEAQLSSPSTWKKQNPVHTTRLSSENTAQWPVSGGVHLHEIPSRDPRRSTISGRTSRVE